MNGTSDTRVSVIIVGAISRYGYQKRSRDALAAFAGMASGMLVNAILRLRGPRPETT
jgi:hypothetical protein